MSVQEEETQLQLIIITHKKINICILGTFRSAVAYKVMTECTAHDAGLTSIYVYI